MNCSLQVRLLQRILIVPCFVLPGMTSLQDGMVAAFFLRSGSTRGGGVQSRTLQKRSDRCGALQR